MTTPSCLLLRWAAQGAANTLLAALGLVPLAGMVQDRVQAGRAAVYESLAFGVPLDEPVPSDGLPDDVRQALRQFTARAKRFVTRIPEPTGNEEREVWGERTGIERVVFSLFETSGVSGEAEAFVQSLPFYYEAEGDIWVVLRVPDGADGYLKAHPESIARDYVRFFSGHRRSCGLRGSQLSLTAEGKRQLGQARATLRLAAQSRHPLIRFVAQHELTHGCAR